MNRAPKEGPGFLHVETLRWVAMVHEDEVMFFRGKTIAHPKNEFLQNQYYEAKRRVKWFTDKAREVERLQKEANENFKTEDGQPI